MNRILIVAVLAGVAGFAAGANTGAPQFKDGNQLVRPEGHHQWVFVGSSLGMSYRKDAGYENAPEFHNVYITPNAYQEFREKGTFPDGTVMVLEIVASGGNASINKAGKFEDKILGIEASVKDSKRFPEKWAYFGFMGEKGEALAEAKPFPKSACWSCHNPHGQVDNVFVQFYPVLREAREKAAH
ncbi:MAG TPA: cytochrome P460 family protein [Terriglobia bacterium]|nr:cytochrome P460 family protein [Terriglobia bacterium]